MNFTSQIASFTSETTLSSIPRLLWEYYLEYLWFYDDGSWVARIASTFRVLAFLLIIPMTGISLLDITSYLIARTLGIVDDVKASTSDKGTIHNKEGMPSLDLPSLDLRDVSTDSTPSSGAVSDVPITTTKSDRLKPPSKERRSTQQPHVPPQAFFASEDMQLKISGEGVFSPAVSQPSSPTITRRHLRNEWSDE